MANGIPQSLRTVAGVAAVSYAALLYQQADGFSVADPQPVLHAGLGYAGGTLIAEGGYQSSPPNAPIEVKRRMIGGAALPDS